MKDERIGDGEFYMSKEDFIQHFDNMDLCHLTPDSMDAEVNNTGFWVLSASDRGTVVLGNLSVLKKVLYSYLKVAKFEKYII